MRAKLAITLLALALVPALAAGCGDTSGSARAATERASACPRAWRADWQRLADRTQARVYCPAWLPQPLTGQLAPDTTYPGGGGLALSVSRDRSWLASMLATDETGEVHVAFRAYPGRTAIPRCRQDDTLAGKTVHRTVPCFDDPHGEYRAGPIRATLYTVNQGVDQWHLLYAWRRAGTLYTLSEHVTPPYSYPQVLANLHRMLRRLVPLAPSR